MKCCDEAPDPNARPECQDVPFLYTMPSTTLAPKITKPAAINGASESVEIGAWNDGGKILELIGRASGSTGVNK